jgi:hypothetical protein
MSDHICLPGKQPAWAALSSGRPDVFNLFQVSTWAETWSITGVFPQSHAWSKFPLPAALGAFAQRQKLLCARTCRPSRHPGERAFSAIPVAIHLAPRTDASGGCWSGAAAKQHNGRPRAAHDRVCEAELAPAIDAHLDTGNLPDRDRLHDRFKPIGRRSQTSPSSSCLSPPMTS